MSKSKVIAKVTDKNEVQTFNNESFSEAVAGLATLNASEAIQQHLDHAPIMNEEQLGVNLTAIKAANTSNVLASIRMYLGLQATLSNMGGYINSEAFMSMAGFTDKQAALMKQVFSVDGATKFFKTDSRRTFDISTLDTDNQVLWKVAFEVYQDAVCRTFGFTDYADTAAFRSSFFSALKHLFEGEFDVAETVQGLKNGREVYNPTLIDLTPKRLSPITSVIAGIVSVMKKAAVTAKEPAPMKSEIHEHVMEKIGEALVACYPSKKAYSAQLYIYQAFAKQNNGGPFWSESYLFEVTKVLKRWLLDNGHGGPYNDLKQKGTVKFNPSNVEGLTLQGQATVGTQNEGTFTPLFTIDPNHPLAEAVLNKLGMPEKLRPDLDAVSNLQESIPEGHNGPFLVVTFDGLVQGVFCQNGNIKFYFDADSPIIGDIAKACAAYEADLAAIPNTPENAQSADQPATNASVFEGQTSDAESEGVNNPDVTIWNSILDKAEKEADDEQGNPNAES